MLLNELRLIIKDVVDISEEEIHLESMLYDDLDLDSLDMSQVIIALENKYSIEIEDEIFLEFETVKDIISHLENVIS